MIIQSKRIWLLEHWVEAQLDLSEGKIKAVYPYGSKPVDHDYGNDRILPGFIDTHCHGAFGFDTNDAEEQGLIEWLRKAPEEGLTSLCPTTITQSEEILTHALTNVAAVAKQKHRGAQIVGIHFEGPYLSVKFKGAQPEPYIVKPDLAQFRRYQKAADNLIRIITVAVEEDQDLSFIRALSADGIAINIGHSGATYQQAVFGFANGASGLTHTYNGMSALNHREPALVGAAMDLGSVYSELICDGVHVSWPATRILFKMKGKDHLVMVTDALCAKGVGEGRYVFGGQTIDIKANGGAYLETGSLAGSTLKFNHGLRNVIELAKVDEASAINACTINPAKVLKLDAHKGKIQAHYDADLTVLDDAYEVVATYVAGNAVFVRP